MATVHDYKRFENNLVQKIKKFMIFIANGIASFFKTVFGALTRRYTVMLVPHSEKKVFNLQVSPLSFVCTLLIFFGVIGAFFWYGTSLSEGKGPIASQDNRLKDAQASLDQLRDEMSVLWREARGFQTALSEVLSVLGINTPVTDNTRAANSGDLSAFFNIQETSEGTLREIEDVRVLASYLASTVDPLREIGTLIDTQSALFTEIPNIWPIRGSIGHISFHFGQQENPFTGQYYIHKGIDLSTYRQGDPVIATADGQVVTASYDDSFGNYVIIKHKHGFYTRYAHLLQYRVKVGDRVQQGEVIGNIGNTGVSTGPHLHYEVHIGSDVVDPYPFLNIR